jgi:tyrosyl-tRNA synthetase
VWLTAEKTKPFDYYQFWLRTEDADVARYLRLFTFLPLEEIDAIVAEHTQAPERRVAQKRLAEEQTKLVHGAEAAAQAISASQTLYGGADRLDDAAVAALAAQGVPTTTIARSKLDAGWPVLDALVETGLTRSKGDARRLIAQGGLYVNNETLADPNARLGPQHLATATAIVLRGGKKNYRLVRVDA